MKGCLGFVARLWHINSTATNRHEKTPFFSSPKPKVRSRVGQAWGSFTFSQSSASAGLLGGSGGRDAAERLELRDEAHG